MSMLSDATLLAEIADGHLIVNGDTSRVSHCAYHFVTQKIFEAGPTGAIRDWSDPGPDANYAIDPGAIVWLRTAGIVDMPSNRCAFYWQTNTLSRQGLMLVNSSMVEPGYKGPLACLFANFGRESIIINPETVVAKLVFFELDRDAVKPVDMTYTVEQYDRALKQVASHGAPSFLQISELTRRVDEDAEAAIKRIQSESAEAIRRVTSATETVALGQTRDLERVNDEQLRALRDEKTKQLSELNSDFEKRMRKAFGLAALAIVIAAAVINVFAWMQNYIRPSYERDVQNRVAVEVQRTVARNLAADAAHRDSIDATLSTALAAMRKNLDETSARVTQIERRRR